MPAPTSTVHPEDLRVPLRILSRADVATESSSGGAEPVYTDVFGAAVWAKDQHRKVMSVVEGGKLITTVYHTYTVYYNTRINSSLYIQDPRYANVLYIQGITDPTGIRQWMELTATDIEG